MHMPQGPNYESLKADAERRKELLSSNPAGMMGLLWELTRFVMLALGFAVRLPVSWWLKRRRTRQHRDSLGGPH